MAIQPLPVNAYKNLPATRSHTQAGVLIEPKMHHLLRLQVPQTKNPAALVHKSTFQVDPTKIHQEYFAIPLAVASYELLTCDHNRSDLL